MPVPDLSTAVRYHYDAFPPKSLDSAVLLGPLAEAAAALARYDIMLRQMHNSEILLAPLRRQEAVVSSRMEGTITTLDDVLLYEAEHGEEDATRPSAAMEVLAHARTMRMIQTEMEGGRRISEWLIRAAHRALMRLGRGAKQSPGDYKTEQNFLADRRGKVSFVPISPEQLKPHMEKLIAYIEDGDDHSLIKAAVTHVEFEALHPFKDGNGRLGRMLITLQLWQSGQIAAPHFYISQYFEDRRDAYIDRMRDVSETGDWTAWVAFFLHAVAQQATDGCTQMERITALHEETRNDWRELLGSKDYLRAVDFVFGQPVFDNSTLVSETGLPRATAARFTRLLEQGERLRVVTPGAGRRGKILAFEPLLEVLRG